VSRKNVEDLYPLSPLQQGMLFHALYSPESGAYSEQMPLLVEGGLDVDAHARAVQRTVDRHAALRTGLLWQKVPQPLQVVFREAQVPVQRLDWTGRPDEAWRADLAEFLAEDRRRGFDLTKAPLLRCTYVRLDGDRWLFVFTFHHVILDGWSTPLLWADVDAFYRAELEGRTLDLPPAPRYRDYVAWLQKQDPAAAEAFWRAALDGFATPTPLPLDRGGAVVAEEHASARRRLSPAQQRRLGEFAREVAVTPSTVMQGAWALTLARWSGERDVLFGMVVAGRPAELPRVEQIIGLFINTVPVRVRVPEAGSVGEWLRGLQQAQGAIRQHEHVSLVDVQGWSAVPRDRPLFESAYVFENAPIDAGDDDDPVHQVTADVGERVNYALTLVVVPNAEIELRLNYNPRRFSADDAERILDTLLAALDALTASASLPLAKAEVLTEGERRTVQAWARGPAVDASATVHRLFEAQAARTPDAPALEMEGRTVPYAELDARASRLARRLRARGVRRDSVVAVSLERSLELPLAVLAAMKAGGAFLGLDPRDPAQRRRRVLADSGAAVLLTSGDLAAGMEDLLPVVDVAAEEAAAASELSHPLDVEVDADGAAYVLYTSGSTGIPKGVVVPHRGIPTAVGAGAPRVAAGARVLQAIPFTFDLFVMELGTALLHGGCLVLARRERIAPGPDMAALLRDERINVLVAVPTMLAATPEGGLPELRTVFVGGEALPEPVARRWGAVSALVNVYGPTEITIFCTHAGPLHGGEPSPIGVPAPGVGAWVVDAGLRLVAPGATGELFIGGVGVSRGYLARPALTAERFVPDPFGGEPGARMYRTGDRVRWRPDGQLDFLGRADFQVKVRGFRIEPGEVEAALASLPEVAAAAVVAREDTPGDARLVGYVTPAGDAQPAAAELRRALSSMLPAHMVPSEFVVLDRLPLNANGKVDRRALPAPGPAAAPAGKVPPRTPAEALVADIFEQVLGTRPGVHDNFFDLGGHSLRATQVVSRVREALGADLPLRALFEEPTIAGVAARAVAARAGGAVPAPPLVPQPREGDLPLSFAQQRFWFVERMGAAGNVYNMPMSLRLRGPLDADALRRALDGVVARHEALRTVFPMVDGQPVQRILPELRLPLPVLDLSALPDAEREAQMRRYSREEMEATFDLEHGPVIRARLLRLAADDHLLLLSLHHIAGDAWSMDVLFDELEVLYAAARDGREAALPPLAVQYADYAIWQRRRMRGEALEAELAYWRARLDGAATLDLPMDRPRPPVQSFRGAEVDVDLGAELSAALGELARRSGATPFMVLLAGFQLLLQRWSGTDDVIVGSPIAGRTPRETEGLIGVFLNTLALRTDLSGDPTFAQLLGRVRETALDAFAHQDVPFERLVEELRIERSVARHPLFQVMFSMIPGAPDSEAAFADLRIQATDFEDTPAKVDLTLTGAETDGRLRCAISYAADLWDASTMRRLAEHLRALLSAAAADPQAPVSMLAMIGDDERRRVVEEWNRTEAEEDTTPAQVLLARWVARIPDTPAVLGEEESLTYGQLDARATQLAHRLRRMGVGPDRRVAVMLERSAAMAVAAVAVLKAGGAYLPLDPTGPAERAAYMLGTADAVAVLTRAGLRDRLPATDAAVIALDEEAAALAAESLAPVEVKVDPDNLAYIIFTSGSTGRPKGVAVPHRGLSSLAAWYRGACGMGPGEHSTMLVAPTFDVSVLDVWGPLTAGSTVHVVPDALRLDPPGLLRWVDARGITIWDTPTPIAHAALDEMARGAPRPRALRMILTGGEALGRRPPPGLTLLNLYGPAENSCVSTAADVAPAGVSLPPIGRPLPNQQAYVLDGRMQPVPVGVPGELYVAGVGLARGYLAKPAMTAERFIPNPFGAPGSRMYVTGDRVRWLPDGELEFQGRTDHQVKLRGYRIEIGEIEVALLTHPAVAQAAVVLRSEHGGRLVAYVSPAEGGDAPDAAGMRAHLRARLPDYMVPSAFVVMDKLPQTPNGKVDRKALPAPAAEPRAAARPQSGVERRIAQVWTEVLGIETVGLDDNFFEIGGHSMLVARMQERLAVALGREVSIVELFQFPTVAALAAHLEPARDGEPAAPPVPAEAAERGSSRRDMMRRQRAR
jgi:amino acid adenylation domain-containing protein